MGALDAPAAFAQCPERVHELIFNNHEAVCSYDARPCWFTRSTLFKVHSAFTRSDARNREDVKKFNDNMNKNDIKDARREERRIRKGLAEEELDASACEASIMVAEHGLTPEQFELQGGAGSSPAGSSPAGSSPAGTAASHTASLQLSPSDSVASSTVRCPWRPFRRPS